MKSPFARWKFIPEVENSYMMLKNSFEIFGKGASRFIIIAFFRNN